MTDREYSWTASVLEAFGSPRECAKSKVTLAERAIAARLHISPVPDWYETQALEMALSTLHGLTGVISTAPVQLDS